MVKFIVKASALLVRQIRSLVSGETDLRPELAELRIKLTELLTQTSQLSDALRHANGLPIPPRHLQERVVGGYVPGFIGSGTRVMAEFESILQCAGKRLTDFNHVLDLGVGCGRVIRRFHELYSEADLTGRLRAPRGRRNPAATGPGQQRSVRSKLPQDPRPKSPIKAAYVSSRPQLTLALLVGVLQSAMALRVMTKRQQPRLHNSVC